MKALLSWMRHSSLRYEWLMEVEMQVHHGAYLPIWPPRIEAYELEFAVIRIGLLFGLY